jgi:hypothetical protein
MVMTLIVACGGTSTRDQSSSGSDGGGDGAAAGVSGSGDGGGTIVITSEPDSCTTSAGEVGMLVDLFPYPTGPAECEALNAPGEPASTCPSDSLYVCDPIDCYSAADMPGCCRPDGTCGLLEKGYFSATRKLGCVSREPWLENEAFLGRTLAPVSCASAE